MRSSYTEKNIIDEHGEQDIRQTRNTGPIYIILILILCNSPVESWSETDDRYHSTVTVSRMPHRPFQL